jgi:hypothetical protein
MTDQPPTCSAGSGKLYRSLSLYVHAAIASLLKNIFFLYNSFFNVLKQKALVDSAFKKVSNAEHRGEVSRGSRERLFPNTSIRLDGSQPPSRSLILIRLRWKSISIFWPRRAARYGHYNLRDH